MNFQFHGGFEKEIAALQGRRLRYIRESLAGFQKICEVHFHPTHPERRINPGKIHRLTQNDTWTMWKTELPVLHAGLRPNQYPRIWFVVSGETIAFLCIASHVDNYKDKEMDSLAVSRTTDLF